MTDKDKEQIHDFLDIKTDEIFNELIDELE